MIKSIERFIHKRNTNRSLKERKEETEVVFELISKEADQSTSYVLSTYLNGIDSYRKGLDAASIGYCGLSVELGLVFRLNEKNLQIPGKFWQLRDLAKQNGIIPNSNSVKRVEDVERLRNAYVHRQSLLSYLALSAKAELHSWEMIYGMERAGIERGWIRFDAYMKRAFNHVQEEYNEKKAVFEQLEGFSHVGLNPRTMAFLKNRQHEFQSFLGRKYDFVHMGGVNDKNYKKWKKAMHVSKFLGSGDHLDLYTVSRFDAVTQIEWSFKVLKDLRFIPSDYEMLYDEHGIDYYHGKFVIYEPRKY